MSRNTRIWAVALVGIAMCGASAVAHEPHQINTGTANTYILLTASTGVQYPTDGEVVNGGQAVEQSNSYHFVSLKNNNPWYTIPGTYDWKMGLTHDLETNPHSANDQTGASVSLSPMQEVVYAAGLSKLLDVPTGSHSVYADAAIRKGGAGNPWVVAPSHTHGYQRNN